MKNFDNFHGSTVIGKKGQIVIPMETRKNMGWKEGEKLLVFGLKNGTVVLARLDQVKRFTAQLEKKVNAVKKYLKK